MNKLDGHKAFAMIYMMMGFHFLEGDHSWFITCLACYFLLCCGYHFWNITLCLIRGDV